MNTQNKIIYIVVWCIIGTSIYFNYAFYSQNTNLSIKLDRANENYKLCRTNITDILKNDPEYIKAKESIQNIYHKYPAIYSWSDLFSKK